MMVSQLAGLTLPPYKMRTPSLKVSTNSGSIPTPRSFLDRIDKKVPADLNVHLVLDNYSTHKTPLINRWLVRHPRFQLHFTPPYSSWINQVERWFALLTEKQIRRRTHRSTRALEDAIRLYLAVHNEDPKPFVWIKTADDLLANIARFCLQTSEAGH